MIAASPCLASHNIKFTVLMAPLAPIASYDADLVLPLLPMRLLLAKSIFVLV